MKKISPHHAVSEYAALAEAQRVQAQALAAAMPFNAGKALELGRGNAISPPRGAAPAVDAPEASASTLSETNASTKTGEAPPSGRSALSGSLDAMRSNAVAQVLTTNQGVAVGDNQNSLKAGLRGPTLLEDFIQDAMKFPDLIHAVKPEPHNGMPQAASAHDTFWDFASLMPESTHTLLWVMSDRGIPRIPRSLRMMQGFGVHTYRLVNAKGESHFVKFHWKPRLGTHALVWDEAVKISGADSDFHRHDLWDAIESGDYPEWELGLQIFTEAQAESFSFDVLDATKLIPEELVPVTPVGRMVLNRNPDNFFAETEQVAFCTAHVVPSIDFSNDPLLAGRIHSYIDTQITRLGGANFHEIPINAPLAAVHNNQRDGLHRQAIPRGRDAYEPNSLGGGCPFQAGAAELAATVAAGLGIPVPPAMTKVLAHPARPEVARSAALSLMALPGDGGIRSRRVAILVTDGVDGPSMATLQAALQAAGATAHLIAPRLGPVKPASGDPFDATGTLENSPPVLFDGLVLPDGAVGVKTLGEHFEVMDFIANHFRHGKTLLAIGASQALLARAGATASHASGEPDPGIFIAAAAEVEHAAADFIVALGKHRHPEREAGALAP